MDNKNNQPFIICPVCAGKGKTKFGLACPNCSGVGVGSFYHGRFFYWGPKLGRAMIELDHFRKKINNTINLIAFAIGFIGILALGLWVFIVGREANDLSV